MKHCRKMNTNIRGVDKNAEYDSEKCTSSISRMDKLVNIGKVANAVRGKCNSLPCHQGKCFSALCYQTRVQFK